MSSEFESEFSFAISKSKTKPSGTQAERLRIRLFCRQDFYFRGVRNLKFSLISILLFEHTKRDKWRSYPDLSCSFEDTNEYMERRVTLL
jgi:hypothetical protein